MAQLHTKLCSGRIYDIWRVIVMYCGTYDML